MRTSRALILVFGIAVVLLQFAALLLIRESAVPIITIGIPSMMGLIGAYVVRNGGQSKT